MPDFIPDLPVVLAFTVAGFILFITPGPDMSLWLSRTLIGGKPAGMAAMLGTSAGCCVHSVLAALGISVLIQASPVAFNTMKVVGALYLAWLAVQMIRHGTVLNVATDGGAARRLSLWRTFLTGVMVNLSNPKVVIFFITFLPGFVSASDPDAGAKLLFLGLYFVIVNLFLAAALIAFADRFVAAMRANPRVLRIIDWAFAGVFGIFAVTILRTQAKG
jgi:threonine/homoserine/homoserine lactone efflux protein